MNSENGESGAPAPGVRRAQVPPALGGARLDRALAALFAGLSRSRLQALVREGRVTVDGAPASRPGATVEAESELVVDVPAEAEATSVEGRPIRELVVLYEDQHVVVIDKPAGLAAHGGGRVRAGTVAQLAVARYGALPEVQGADRPGIVHRLDRLTSGVMVLGRTPAALEGLKVQFRERRVEKTYLALCHFAPRFDTEWIEVPIEASPRHPERSRVARGGEGREAITFLECRERFRGFAFMAAHPKTGRTHQVRVHLAHAGLPIVGDRQYRHPGALPVPLPASAPAMKRQALHAALLAFEHPLTGERLRFEAPLPEDMARLLAWLRAEQRLRT